MTVNDFGSKLKKNLPLDKLPNPLSLLKQKVDEPRQSYRHVYNSPAHREATMDAVRKANARQRQNQASDR